MPDFKDALDYYLKCRVLAKDKQLLTENVMKMYELMLYEDRTRVIKEQSEEMREQIKELNKNMEIMKDSLETFVKEYLHSKMK